ncbi:MAG: hypothetical protein GF417_01305 [Candidatus Latescibacteria bacterium]|nr:hypothetical protein [bacterium]MBD3423063.1 hypothetical protein [Candidatus Latescibacterota bacterium]
MKFEYQDTMVGGIVGPITMCQVGTDSMLICCSCYTVNSGDGSNCSMTMTTYTNV